MLKSPNDVLIESKDGRGNINMKGTVNIDTANIRNLSCNAINDIRQQVQDLRRQISSVTTTVSQAAPSVPTTVSPTNLQSVVQQVLRQQQSQQQPQTSNDVSLMNARLNTLQDRLNNLETRINDALVSIDERISAISAISAITSGLSVSGTTTNESPSDPIPINNNVVILRKTPVTNKNVRYAW
jgi:hypothetical protein